MPTPLSQDIKKSLQDKIQQSQELSPADKSALYGLLSERKRYGLVWEDKPEQAYEQLRTQIPVFTEVPERRIMGSSADAPNHILIEGDNLHALTAMQYTHAGKVDVIYIDPPYNTGNKDFSYNDTFVDKEDQWRHSKWLSFMEKRLKLAKTLLKETGVIFISIDDNEQAQLKLLCDEVFATEDNHIGTFIWQTRTGSMDAVNSFSSDHEYVLAYGNTADAKLSGILRTFDRYENSDNDPRGPWIADNLSAGKPGGNTFYAIIDPINGKEYWPPQGRYWPYSPETMKQKISEGRILFPKKDSGTPLVKRFQNEAKFDTLPVSSCLVSDSLSDSKRKNNTLYVSFTTGGTKELQEIFGDKAFKHPKPSLLIRALLSTISPNQLILDFFAGSGTTLHATMALNAEDGGKRQCILVTNNENDICEKVTYERNKRVIQGYANAKGEQVPGLTNNSLRYYKIDFAERIDSFKNRRDLVRKSLDLACIKEGCYKPRAELSQREFQVFESNEFLLFMVLDTDSIEEVVACIETQEKHCKVFVSSPGAYPFVEDFDAVKSRVDLVALPQAYYDALEAILPKTSLLSDGAES